VSSSALEAIVKHDGRLDLLCCILDGGPLSVAQMSARTGEPASAVDHWVELLGTFGLVEKVADLDGGEPLYAATLDEHPAWVREAIERHRSGP
jgi:DNA-binding transcriptional ArsR family regulator